MVVYCAEPLDYVILRPILKHLPPLPFVAKNRRTQKYLQQQGVVSGRLPSFPMAMITCRHAAHKFPDDRIIKIGFRHGAYHFKAFANKRAYQAFTCYGVTSRAEVEQLRQYGVNNAVAVGFPKLDAAFDGSYDRQCLQQIRQATRMDPTKPTVMFSATWDRSGLSAISLWIDHLQQLAAEYNILVTVHPWTSKKYVARLENMPYIHFIRDPDVLPYLMISDVMVADFSSIIAEGCALDKPIVRFKVPQTGRHVAEVERILHSISEEVMSFGQMVAAIKKSLAAPMARQVARKRAAQLMFDQLDGQAGQRAAALVRKVLQENGIFLQ